MFTRNSEQDRGNVSVSVSVSEQVIAVDFRMKVLPTGSGGIPGFAFRLRFCFGLLGNCSAQYLIWDISVPVDMTVGHGWGNVSVSEQAVAVDFGMKLLPARFA